MAPVRVFVSLWALSLVYIKSHVASFCSWTGWFESPEKHFFLWHGSCKTAKFCLWVVSLFLWLFKSKNFLFPWLPCSFLISKVIKATPVDEWLRTLIFSALNRSSSNRCGFEPSSGHMSDKPSSACGWSGGFSQGSQVFAPPNDWQGSKWVK